MDPNFHSFGYSKPITGVEFRQEGEDKRLVVEYWDEAAKVWKPLEGMTTPTLTPGRAIYWSAGCPTAAEYWAAVLPLE